MLHCIRIERMRLNVNCNEIIELQSVVRLPMCIIHHARLFGRDTLILIFISKTMITLIVQKTSIL